MAVVEVLECWLRLLLVLVRLVWVAEVMEVDLEEEAQEQMVLEAAAVAAACFHPAVQVAVE